MTKQSHMWVQGWRERLALGAYVEAWNGLNLLRKECRWVEDQWEDFRFSIIWVMQRKSKQAIKGGWDRVPSNVANKQKNMTSRNPRQSKNVLGRIKWTVHKGDEGFENYIISLPLYLNNRKKDIIETKKYISLPESFAFSERELRNGAVARRWSTVRYVYFSFNIRDTGDSNYLVFFFPNGNDIVEREMLDPGERRGWTVVAWVMTSRGWRGEIRNTGVGLALDRSRGAAYSSRQNVKECEYRWGRLAVWVWRDVAISDLAVSRKWVQGYARSL